MKKNSKHIHCDDCSTLTKTKMTNLEIPRLGKKYELQVKAEVCPNCGATYIPGKTAKNFEKLLKKSIIA